MNNFLYVGVDISSKTFDACFLYGKRHSFQRFNNEPAGHHRFIQELGRRKSRIRVVLEATGIYHLELAYALHQASNIEVCVLNPRVFKAFACAMAKRSKNDQRDAHTLANYGQRMEFEPWQPPEEVLVNLRSLTRRMTQLSEDIRREKVSQPPGRPSGSISTESAPSPSGMMNSAQCR